MTAHVTAETHMRSTAVINRIATKIRLTANPITAPQSNDFRTPSKTSLFLYFLKIDLISSIAEPPFDQFFPRISVGCKAVGILPILKSVVTTYSFIIGIEIS